MAVLNNAVATLKNNAGQREKEKVLYTLFSMKGDVVMQ